MIYLTNDSYDQAVYFHLRGRQSVRCGAGKSERVYGIVGNGVTEVAVMVREEKGCQEVVFGREDLFSVVDECLLRKIVSEAVGELMH